MDYSSWQMARKDLDQNIQLSQQETGENQPSELVTGRCNILPPSSAYCQPPNDKDDGDAVQTVLEGKRQLVTVDSGLGTWSSQTAGLEDPSHHTMLTESRTQTKVPHTQEKCKNSLHHVTERFHLNPLSHLLVLGEGPLIPGKLLCIEGQRHDMHTGKNEEWSRKIGNEQKYLSSPSTAKTPQDTVHPP